MWREVKEERKLGGSWEEAREMKCGRGEMKGSFGTRPSVELERLGGKNAIMSH